MKNVTFFLIAVLFLFAVSASFAQNSVDSMELVQSFKVSTLDTVTLEIDKGTKVDFVNSADEMLKDFKTDAIIRVSEVVTVRHHRAKVLTPALVKTGRYTITKNENTISSTNINESPVIMSGGKNIEDKIERVIISKPECVNVKVIIRE